MIFQAGDSEEGREFAAETADAIFTRHGGYEPGRAFYADVKGGWRATAADPRTWSSCRRPPSYSAQPTPKPRTCCAT